jgi:Zn-dependent protease
MTEQAEPKASPAVKRPVALLRNPSFLMFAAVAVALVAGRLSSDSAPLDLLVTAAIWYAIFLFSLICHEAAHSTAALLGGDSTAAKAGQITLNPLPHIRREPFGMVLFPLLSFGASGGMIGWASAPYSLKWQQQFPRRAALMALAGPAANLALVLAAATAIRLGVAFDYLEPSYPATFDRVTALASNGSSNLVTTSLSILFSLNLLLCIFNLLPVPPLDGSTAISLLLPQKAARAYTNWLRSGSLNAIGLLLALFFFGSAFNDIFRSAAQLLYAWI